MRYVRYEAELPLPSGGHTGIFGLANGPARAGKVSPEDWAWWRAPNDWLDASYPDPGIADPTLFDTKINPTATCWFKTSAVADPILKRVDGYLALLDRYEVAWRERRTDILGHVLYEDAVQVMTDGQP